MPKDEFGAAQSANGNAARSKLERSATQYGCVARRNQYARLRSAAVAIGDGGDCEAGGAGMASAEVRRAAARRSTGVGGASAGIPAGGWSRAAGA